MRCTLIDPGLSEGLVNLAVSLVRSYYRDGLDEGLKRLSEYTVVIDKCRAFQPNERLCGKLLVVL